jgi:hypothetical protein
MTERCRPPKLTYRPPICSPSPPDAPSPGDWPVRIYHGEEALARIDDEIEARKDQIAAINAHVDQLRAAQTAGDLKGA